ncbi:MAG: hypothetical protein ACYCW6_22270 [Candidatus Xenobia bacterium]
MGAEHQVGQVIYYIAKHAVHSGTVAVSRQWVIELTERDRYGRRRHVHQDDVFATEAEARVEMYYRARRRMRSLELQLSLWQRRHQAAVDALEERGIAVL